MSLNNVVPFAVVSSEGIVQRSGQCTDDMVQYQYIEPGEYIISPVSQMYPMVVQADVPDNLTDMSHYWVHYQGWVPLPPRPGEWAEWNGDEWVDTRIPILPEKRLAEQKKRSVSMINMIRGAVRCRFITSIPGQELTYMNKEQSAREWMTAYMSTGEEPSPMDYPTLAYEVGPGMTGETMYQVASIYLFMSEQFRMASSVIEGTSIKYINQVETAVTNPVYLVSAYYQELNSLLPPFEDDLNVFITALENDLRDQGDSNDVQL